MTLRLGIDTGGTFTDAILLNTDGGIVSTNKSLTTYHNLFEGINNAVSGLFTKLGTLEQPISLVGLSTTLATNAMVQNHGRPACLVLIGQPDHVANHPVLRQAIGEDRIIRIAGGHQASGEMIEELDNDELKTQISELSNSVSGFAVAGFFSVRNPAHEIKAKEIIEKMTGRPVTCSHELTSKLDAPKRALTCLFNARLIPLLTELINSINQLLQAHTIFAPVMVVQGDGSLVQASQALFKPVETILSGPAASLHGARFLCALDNALVCDIGGTTTDIVMLEDGAPSLDLSGASVGGFKTMVEAVAVNTRGLGGDSEVQLHLGVPCLSTQRAIPVCQLADQYPQIKQFLDEQLDSDPRETDSRFAVRLVDVESDYRFRSNSEEKIYQLLADGPMTLNTLFESPAYERALNRLRKRGLVNISAFTPTDALHVIGAFKKWNAQPAINTAKLLKRLIVRQLDKQTDIEHISKQVIDLVVDKTCRVVLEAALLHTYKQLDSHCPVNADDMSQILLEQPDNIFFDSKIKFKQPIIAIGAPAQMFYPQVAKRFDCDCIIPEHADVCNAIGAVTSKIIQKTSALITSPTVGTYRVHTSGQIKDFNQLEPARDYASDYCRQAAITDAQKSGAINIEAKIKHKENFVSTLDNYKLFIEAKVVATAVGEPSEHF